MAPKRKSAPQSPARDLFSGVLEMMFLQTPQWQPMHGYALVQDIQQRSKDLLRVEEDSLYPALQRMLKKGLVKAEWKNLLHQSPRPHLHQYAQRSGASGARSIAI